MELIKQAEMFAVPAPAAVTPMDMLDRAISSGATVETLEKLMLLQERWEANQSRKAFNAAMAKAKAEFGDILKNKDGYLKRYKYETLDSVMDAVDPALSKYGFSYDWMTEDTDGGRIRVTCVITHEDGHSKRNSLSGDPKDTADAKANMNGFQRMGGAVTYLQRYTLKAALGIAASEDTDGGGGEEYDTTPWTDRLIAAGKDRAALEKIGEDIKAATDIPESALKMLRAAWSGAIKQAGK